ncbi:hypothetical protein [Caballeronia arvi]|uniref:hypothetical protein n=1 Tax=Caballeronia arvi TaxID=1777135 RepID=UPI000772668F|nr:hypothetical protein [Caballeronia arvi]
MAVTREMKSLLAGRTFFHCDELMFQESIELRLIQSKLLGQVPEQQKGGEFVRAEHGHLVAGVMAADRGTGFHHSHFFGDSSD